MRIIFPRKTELAWHGKHEWVSPNGFGCLQKKKKKGPEPLPTAMRCALGTFSSDNRGDPMHDMTVVVVVVVAYTTHSHSFGCVHLRIYFLGFDEPLAAAAPTLQQPPPPSTGNTNRSCQFPHAERSTHNSMLGQRQCERTTKVK